MSLKRTKRQIEAVNKWIRNSGRGTLEFATGVGKTNTAIIAIKKILKMQLGPVHVVVPTKYLQTQWRNEISRVGLEDHVSVYVINTYLKEKRECDLLILDEIHNYGSLKRLRVFETEHIWLLGLTATIQRRDLHHKIIESYAPVIDKINLDEARDEGYISDFIVYNLGIELSEEDRELLNTYNKEFYKHFSYFGHDFNLAMRCMTDKKERERYGRLMGDNDKTVGFHAIRFNHFMQKRKNFLYNLPSKRDITNYLTSKFYDKKAITFSETIEFAESLNGLSYHSKKKKTEKELVLKLFREGTGTLNTSKALDEGFDVGDIELAIITSSRAVERVDVQRTGRAVRFKEKKLAVIVNLYVKNSKDEDWLRQRQKNSSNIYWVDNVEDIKFERPKIAVSKTNSRGSNQYSIN